MSSRALALLLLGLLLTGPGSRVEAAPAAPAAAPAPVERTIDVDGVERAYLIHVPSAWDRRAPIALLLVFHGAGSDAESMVKATGFEAWAETDPTLIVYPRARRSTKRFDVDGTREQPSADVRFADALLERLQARFPVDTARIYATGFSNGAAFCYRLAADRARTFAAIAPVAGYIPTSVVVGPVEPVATLHAHGLADPRVPPPLSVDAADPARMLGRMLERLHWLMWNARGQRSTTPIQAGPLQGTRLTYGDPTGNAVVEYILLVGEGHVWSGGRGGYLSREIWTFLRAHPKPVGTVPGAAPVAR